ncbi:hypothetical protein ScPMuIL_001124 [Solemya velum]
MEKKTVKYLVSGAVIGGVTLLALWRWMHSMKKRLKFRRLNETQIHVINSSTEWEQHYPILASQLDSHKVLGFDCEWVFDKKRRPVALVQISTQQGFCLLVRTSKIAPNIPESFKKILADRSILKVGVASKDDGKKLQKDYGIVVRGCVDLRHMLGRIRGIYNCSSVGLQGLAAAVLGVNMAKESNIRCGDWEADILSSEQIDYAAQDALVAVDIFTNLVLAKMLGRAPQSNEIDHGAITEVDFWKKARSLCQGLVDILHKSKTMKTIINDSQQALSQQQSTDSVDGKGKGKKHESRAYSLRTRPLYYNCCLLAPDGQLLCTCDVRKVEWYIYKGLAEKVCDDPVTIKLKFEPAGRPKSELDYYLQNKENVCVVCGKSESYIKKLIIPKEYRKYFPPILKDHASHDVLLMCLPCHQMSCQYDSILRQSLAEECEAPLDAGSTSRSFQDHDLQKVRSAAKALLFNKSQIPQKRVEELKSIVTDFFGIDSLSEELLQKAAELDIRVNNPEFLPHGKKVVNHVRKNGGLLNFEKRWRKNFLDNMKPNFLPVMWSVDHQHERYANQMNLESDTLTGECSL